MAADALWIVCCARDNYADYGIMKYVEVQVYLFYVG
jgi:hypothetical protein